MTSVLDRIKAAHERIAPYVVKTPVLRLPALDAYLGCEVYAKAECLQITGAFKLRGAMNKMLQLTPEQLECGVVTASSGNHGKGLSYAAKMLGSKATVVIPDTAPDIKVNAIKNLGAEVVRSTTVERFEVADRIAKETGAMLVPPFNDEDIMCGQGTIGLEILEQLPDVDKIIVPVSGGGLIGGVAAAIKESAPNVKVIGAEPAALPRYTVSLAEGKPVKIEQKPTLADALVSNKPGDICFPWVQKYVDEIVDVTDEDMLKGSKRLLLDGHLLAEFSSAIGIGAVLGGLVDVKPTVKVCFVLSGGSVDLPQLDILKNI
ncbi:MAG: threonine/serine dehydratase [Oscillospiraceae bacterium]|nr:threonine/serine dehydratase [Oscillospiraceae bacterium]